MEVLLGTVVDRIAIRIVDHIATADHKHSAAAIEHMGLAAVHMHFERMGLVADHRGSAAIGHKDLIAVHIGYWHFDCPKDFLHCSSAGTDLRFDNCCSF